MSAWFPKFWFSCAQYAKRLAQAESRPLSATERTALAFHHLWCLDCRRHRTQIVQLDSTLEEFCRAFAEGVIEPTHEGPLILPDEIRRSIASKLAGEK